MVTLLRHHNTDQWRWNWIKIYLSLAQVIVQALHVHWQKLNTVSHSLSFFSKVDLALDEYTSIDICFYRWRLKSPASRLFAQPDIQAQIKENIKAPRYWPLCGEFTGDRWIPHTKGQKHGKCFHLMTSSWTHLLLVPHICSSERGQHWLR